MAKVRPADAAVAKACLLVTTGKADDACVSLLRMLEEAPPGPAGWGWA